MRRRWPIWWPLRGSRRLHEWGGKCDARAWRQGHNDVRRAVRDAGSYLVAEVRRRLHEWIGKCCARAWRQGRNDVRRAARHAGSYVVTDMRRRWPRCKRGAIALDVRRHPGGGRARRSWRIGGLDGEE
ncbi:MAG: hypothetical protein IT162_10940 [Bryobacterales bacterium]|nr:hypothetical protein [Bryobacterales bacterium]